MNAGQNALHDGSQLQPILQPEDAVAALIQLTDGRYVLQLRDAKPHIFYPDYWGCFGGAIDSGETPEAALVRELGEELGLSLSQDSFTRFTCFTHDFTFAGLRTIERLYFHLSLSDLEGLCLHEGADIAAFSAQQALEELRIVPYDAFALWMHHNRERIGCVDAGRN
jgi:8-oxo-dGTP pyrophosphatase MutT (NUDIX family)